MKKLYKYIYTMSNDDTNPFTIEERLIKEDSDYPNPEEMSGWEKDYYMYVDEDNGIAKDAVDNWERINDTDNGRCFYSFKNDKETMLKFKHKMLEVESENLESYVKSVSHITKRIEKLSKSINEED